IPRSQVRDLPGPSKKRSGRARGLGGRPGFRRFLEEPETEEGDQEQRHVRTSTRGLTVAPGREEDIRYDEHGKSSERKQPRIAPLQIASKREYEHDRSDQGGGSRNA